METLLTKKVSIVLRPNMKLQNAGSRVMEAAKDMFFRYGTKSVSMDDIANHLGVSKKTIYHEFANKDELVAAIIRDSMERNRENIEGCVIAAKDAIEESLKALSQMQEHFSLMHPSLLFDIQKFHPEVYRLFLKHKENFILEKIRTNLHWGIKAGLYRADIDVEIYSRLRVEIMLLVFKQDVWKGIDHDITRISREVGIQSLYGVVSEKGYKLLEHYLNSALPNHTKQKKHAKN